MYYLIYSFKEDASWGYGIFGDPQGDLRVIPQSIRGYEDKNRIAFERKHSDGRWYMMYTKPGRIIREYGNRADAEIEQDRLLAVHEVMDS